MSESKFQAGDFVRGKIDKIWTPNDFSGPDSFKAGSCFEVLEVNPFGAKFDLNLRSLNTGKIYKGCPSTSFEPL